MSKAEALLHNTQPRIDAYCHVDQPRFGNAEDALAVASLWGIRHSVLVLEPGVPDYRTFFIAMHSMGERVHGIGIPFGETAKQKVEPQLFHPKEYS